MSAFAALLLGFGLGGLVATVSAAAARQRMGGACRRIADRTADMLTRREFETWKRAFEFRLGAAEGRAALDAQWSKVEKAFDRAERVLDGETSDKTDAELKWLRDRVLGSEG